MTANALSVSNQSFLTIYMSRSRRPAPHAAPRRGRGGPASRTPVRLAVSVGLALLGSGAAAQSSAYVEQVGDGNLALVEQALARPGQNDVRVVQVGAGGHVSRLDQGGGGTADVRQDGSGHLLAGLTGGAADPDAFALSLDGSRLVLRQVGGEGSRAFVEQRDGALAEIAQFGSDNLAVVVQAGGAGNRAFVDQAGGHSAFVTQNGFGNVARVNQTGPLP